MLKERTELEAPKVSLKKISLNQYNKLLNCHVFSHINYKIVLCLFLSCIELYDSLSREVQLIIYLVIVNSINYLIMLYFFTGDH